MVTMENVLTWVTVLMVTAESITWRPLSMVTVGAKTTDMLCKKTYIPTPGNLLGMYWKRTKPSLINGVHYVSNTYPIDSQGVGMYAFVQ